jgi:hypothetical protein
MVDNSLIDIADDMERLERRIAKRDQEFDDWEDYNE